MSTPPSAYDDDLPRFRWLRRIVLTVAVVLLALAGLRVWAGYRAQARLDATIAELRTRGEPLTVAELRPGRVSPKENRAIYVRAALDLWPRVSQEADPAWPDPANEGLLLTQTWWYSYHYRSSPPLPGGPTDPVADDAAYLAALEPALAQLRRGEAATVTNWDTAVEEPSRDTALPHLNAVRAVSDLLKDSAVRAAARGDAALQLELIRLQSVPTDASVDDALSFLIEKMVAGSIHGRMLDSIPASLPTSPGSREQIERLLRVLLDERSLREGLVSAWRGERASALETYDGVISDRIDPESELFLSERPKFLGVSAVSPVMRTLIRPLLINDERQMLLYLSVHVDAARTARSAPHYNKIYATSEVLDLDQARIDHPWLYPLSRPFLPWPQSVGWKHFQSLAARRAAALRLAAHLYQLDHGRPPTGVADLVPDYLPNVPQDPYTEFPMLLPPPAPAN